jgi:hypothetical protein
MTDRDKRPDKNATGTNPPTRSDNRSEPQHPDLGQRADPDSEQSTTSRPRGHTEAPDRTL